MGVINYFNFVQKIIPIVKWNKLSNIVDHLNQIRKIMKKLKT